MADDLDALRAEYEEKNALYDRFCAQLDQQISELLRQEGIALAVPIEKRVKPWESIREKCERKKVVPAALAHIVDLAGLRVILLFRRDQDRVCELLKTNFEVLDIEDTLDRLSVDQFGYGSVHFDVRPREEWLRLPTLREMEGLRAEIQVRTASQHIWAAASHSLHYKLERHVPSPFRRALNRVAALLELVDLEFERVLGGRDAYVAELPESWEDEPLNTDLVQRILAEELPPENAERGEDFASLVDELHELGVEDTRCLRRIIRRHRDRILSADRAAVRDIREYEPGSERGGVGYSKSGQSRALERGVCYTHVGLARKALAREFHLGITIRADGQ